jgi:hypothetical protein
MASTQDAASYAHGLISHINELIDVLNSLQVDQDRQTQDPDLAQAAADAMNGANRPNLTAVDFTNAANAIGQLLFAYNSGSPTQKSYLYALL